MYLCNYYDEYVINPEISETEMKQNQMEQMKYVHATIYIANPVFFCPREFRLGCKQREKRYSSTNFVSYMQSCMINSSTFGIATLAENSVLARVHDIMYPWY